MSLSNWFIAFPATLKNFELPTAPPGVRLFSALDRHLTIAFLGPVGQAQAEVAWHAVRDTQWRALDATLGEMKALGSPRKPSSLSATLEKGKVEVEKMIESRSAIFEKLTLTPPKLPPLAHITLARIKRHASGEDRMAVLDWMHSLPVRGTECRIDRIALFTWAENRNESLFRNCEGGNDCEFAQNILGSHA